MGYTSHNVVTDVFIATTVADNDLMVCGEGFLQIDGYYYPGTLQHRLSSRERPSLMSQYWQTAEEYESIAQGIYSG